MKKTLLAFAVVFGITTAGVIASQSGAAQTDKPKEGTASQKVDAKPHTMTGCLEKGSDETMFRLTNVEGSGPKTVELHADAKLKLAGHVGHKVAITGTEVDPKTMKKGTGTGTGTGTAGTTGAGAASAGEHHMRVRSMKHIAETCS